MHDPATLARINAEHLARQSGTPAVLRYELPNGQWIDLNALPEAIATLTALSRVDQWKATARAALGPSDLSAVANAARTALDKLKVAE